MIMIMIIITTDCVPGRDVREILGVVQGSTVRAKHLGRDIMAGLKNIVGGELRGYTELMREAREEAMERMAKEAERWGGRGFECASGHRCGDRRGSGNSCLWHGCPARWRGDGGMVVNTRAAYQTACSPLVQTLLALASMRLIAGSIS